MLEWVLIVYLTTSTPPKVFHTETFATESECLQWAQFYNEYPFRPICEKNERI